jgi:N-formylglutamate deformylase
MAGFKTAAAAGHGDATASAPISGSSVLLHQAHAPAHQAWVTVQAGHAELALPLVCDSPHSGTHYPDDFGHAIPRAALRWAEDTHVERLWSAAPTLGATMIQAHFPRSYVDVNRGLHDLDATMLDAPWPADAGVALAPSARTCELGMGLVWRQTPARAPIYARKLGVDEVRRRLEQCWQPYHAALHRACDQAWQRWGACWHLNLHSMPSNAYERLGLAVSRPLADFVLGDLRGQSCSPEFTETVRRVITDHGYRVAVNDPNQGQELVRLHGRPAQRRHSLQIEVNRALYMDEATREPGIGFEALQADISSMLLEVCRFVRERLREDAGPTRLEAEPGA